MKQNEVNIKECLPMLRQVLNISGFARLMGKKQSWFSDKERDDTPFESLQRGFTEDNIELINYGLDKVVAACAKHRLQHPSECSNREIYNKYVSAELKELRKLVSMVYLRENYTKIPQSSWNKKINNFSNRGTIYQFTESDIQQINHGIDKVAELLSSIKVTL